MIIKINFNIKNFGKKALPNLQLLQTKYNAIPVPIQAGMLDSFILLLCSQISLSQNSIISTIQTAMIFLTVCVFFSGLILNCLKAFGIRLISPFKLIAYYMFHITAGLTFFIWVTKTI